MWISFHIFHKCSHHIYYLIQLDQPFIAALLPQIRITQIVSMFKNNIFSLRLFSQERSLHCSSTNMIVSQQTWTANTLNQWSLIILTICTHNCYLLLNFLGFLYHSVLFWFDIFNMSHVWACVGLNLIWLLNAVCTCSLWNKK